MMEGSLVPAPLNRTDMIDLAAQIQRMRIDVFGKDLFTIPAFEMLLDLYTRLDRQPRSLTSLTTASSTSERNSQRIVHRLADRGLVELSRDPEDGRRILVDLSVQARQMLDRFFDRIVLLTGDLTLTAEFPR